ncbi:MAG: N-acetylmuramoyl-L-alanine amidase [Verrucomicrobiota bacterium]|nr:N-acetylmuramoyl-L-alanine amidase [Verrucomicrobiota bacterium]
MFRRGDSLSGRLRRIAAWAGLGLMLASFLWLQLLPETPRAWSPSTSARETDDGLGVVIIDPGHGGQDSGTMHSGLLEKDLALDVGRRIERLLQAKGVSTLLTRTGDNYISLAGRAATANRERDGVFVSIHFDEAQPAAAGVETYYAAHQSARVPMIASWLPFLRTSAQEEPNFESQSLAELVQQALAAKTQAINRGTRAEQFFVIANVRHPAVLVEGGFLTNKEDVGKLMTEDYREQLASAIVDGVLRYRELIRQRQLTAAAGAPGA